jgi:SAM-dependent methyltransferase
VYFQDGHRRGTAFRCYLEAAPHVPFFREMAEIVHRVFQPQRVLELGCATGVSVKFLNDMGVETHGVDVSQWAVAHRAHPNIQLAGAEKLPFPDKHFDVVYSSGTLEHIPPAVLDQAFREIDRVCKTHQFHMLPIIGEGPYQGPRDFVEEGLRADKTHFNLLNRAEWIDHFKKIGWWDTGLYCLYANDTLAFENSWCQLTMTRGEPDPELVRRATKHNVAAAQTIYRRELEFTQRQFRPTPADCAVMSAGDGHRLEPHGDARQHVVDFPTPIDVADAIFRIFVHLEADGPVQLHWAMMTGGSDENLLERFMDAAPGDTMALLRRTDWMVSKGDVRLSEVTRLSFSASAPKCDVRMSLVAVRGQEEIQLMSSRLKFQDAPPPPPPQPRRKSPWPKALRKLFGG